MDAIAYIRLQMASVRKHANGIMSNMTSELFNWPSPGTANTISATFVHFMYSEDHFIQEILQGKPSVWESGGWSAKTGIPKPPGIGENWSEFKHRQIAIQPLMDYTQAVWAATDAYLASLTAEELDRKLNFAGGERSVAEMLVISAAQSESHIGEIAALKGIQGAKGLPI
jgi:hypothetical protein